MNPRGRRRSLHMPLCLPDPGDAGVRDPMTEHYNRFSGQSLERLTALTDGLFAVAMTLLVLGLRVPAGAFRTDLGLWRALLTLGPSFAAYLLSFTMLGTFWLAQHTLLTILGRCDRTLVWIHLGFLFVVTLLPFSAALLADHVHLKLAACRRRHRAVPARDLPAQDPRRPDPLRACRRDLLRQRRRERDRPGCGAARLH